MTADGRYVVALQNRTAGPSLVPATDCDPPCKSGAVCCSCENIVSSTGQPRHASTGYALTGGWLPDANSHMSRRSVELLISARLSCIRAVASALGEKTKVCDVMDFPAFLCRHSVIMPRKCGFATR